jgi:hypothetical protein
MVLPMIAPAANPPSGPAMKGPAFRAGAADAAKADTSGISYYILLDAVSHPAINAFRAKRRFVAA